MAHWNDIIQLLLGVLTLVTLTAASCDDVDPQACVLMAHQTKDFCNDQVLAEAACPRFCHLCPLECYHCTTTVKDFHMCNTTKLCDKGQLCMRKQLVSSVDGHREYQLTCESKQTCDGRGLILPFGKRGAASRDISISCCDSDGCNYPDERTTTTAAATTTKTTTRATTRVTTTAPRTTTPAGCKKDVLIILDESDSSKHYHGYAINFLSSVVQKLDIGPHNVLVALATFAAHATTKWQLNGHTSKSSLSHAVSSVRFTGGFGDLNVAISYAVSHVNPGHYGNRRDAPDVVIIVTDDHARDHVREQSYERQLHAKTSDVIVIGVGTSVTSSELTRVSTDSHHEFRVPNPSNLRSTSLVNSVVQLICKN